MARTSRYSLPPTESPTPAALNSAIREIMLGRVNIAGEVTLLAGDVTTKIYDFHVTGSTVISLTPRSAAAAAIVPWQAANTKGVINLGHAAPGADVDYFYVLIG
jgi:hypothetical protein